MSLLTSELNFVFTAELNRAPNVSVVQTKEEEKKVKITPCSCLASACPGRTRPWSLEARRAINMVMIVSVKKKRTSHPFCAQIPLLKE